MAHQAYSIPWQTLVDNLKYKHCNPRDAGVTNLNLRKGNPSSQGKQFQYFTRGFARALSKYSTIERKKYNPQPQAPQLDEPIISDTAVKRMARTILRYKSDPAISSALGVDLNTVLPPHERDVRWFIQGSGLYEGDMNLVISECCELTKAMLMYGEMDALFRICKHPDVYLQKYWDDRWYANSYGYGLRRLVDAALRAYIFFNVIFLMPELYDSPTREAFIEKEVKAGRTKLRKADFDYRLTAAYQHVVLWNTGVPFGLPRHDVHTHPHREFFGIPRGMFVFEWGDCSEKHWKKERIGTKRLENLTKKEFNNVYVASNADIAVVDGLLRRKGLPTELILQVLEAAEYVPVGRTHIRDDPLHKVNAKELKKYLNYCWLLLIRFDMICKESGSWLDWETLVTEALYTLFNLSGLRSKLKEVPPNDEDFRHRNSKRVFII
ncbi:hypothetical protein BU24DRAFT_480717 [Aaosphaeria arxii CBS 175.79]|uniref:Uncharacterized protein n=1 Tax=Aaosphaeria arxii CBS 175.79 TaxID=1450172 RepID=A0A6A5XUT1_9PLEO|nr:uncharacterized protein BU24DRAFT_480717 [Aaosphaeria arxii CBS 175.79]KAF2016004.1 hypothetical protein BU24DRAFT_480717 [Aaosphaeria arxii CBS 175.79]